MTRSQRLAAYCKGRTQAFVARKLGIPAYAMTYLRRLDLDALIAKIDALDVSEPPQLQALRGVAKHSRNAERKPLPRFDFLTEAAQEATGNRAIVTALRFRCLNSAGEVVAGFSVPRFARTFAKDARLTAIDGLTGIVIYEPKTRRTRRAA